MIKRLLRNTWLGFIEPLRLIQEHRQLLVTLVRRDFRIRTSGSVLGVLWMLLLPALQIVGFWFLLEFVLKARYPGRVPFLDYFLVGMLAWMMMADTLGRSVTILRDMSALYQRSLFPLEILPLLPLLSNVVLYPALFFSVVFVLEGLQSALLSTGILFFLLLWLIPFCYLLAIMGIFLRDLAQLIPFLLTLGMYMTPILYMPEMLPEAAQGFMVLNPFADLMAIVHGFVHGMDMDWWNALRPFGLWLLLLAPTWVLFRRIKIHIREAL